MKTAFSGKADNVLKTVGKRTWDGIEEAGTADMPKRLFSRLKVNQTAVRA